MHPNCTISAELLRGAQHSSSRAGECTLAGMVGLACGHTTARQHVQCVHRMAQSAPCGHNTATAGACSGQDAARAKGQPGASLRQVAATGRARCRLHPPLCCSCQGGVRSTGAAAAVEPRGALGPPAHPLQQQLVVAAPKRENVHYGYEADLRWSARASMSTQGCPACPSTAWHATTSTRTSASTLWNRMGIISGRTAALTVAAPTPWSSDARARTPASSTLTHSSVLAAAWHDLRRQGLVVITRSITSRASAPRLRPHLWQASNKPAPDIWALL